MPAASLHVCWLAEESQTCSRKVEADRLLLPAASLVPYQYRRSHQTCMPVYMSPSSSREDHSSCIAGVSRDVCLTSRSLCKPSGSALLVYLAKICARIDNSSRKCNIRLA